MAVMYQREDFLDYIMFGIGKHVIILKVNYLRNNREYQIITLNDGEFIIKVDDFNDFITHILVELKK